MNKFYYGKGSLQQLVGVDPRLVLCCGYALARVKIDHAVHDGLRTREEQKENVSTGVSRTMNSMHLPQQDGLAKAVDLVPYINGMLRWDSIPAFQEIAKYMREGAELYRFKIIWGAQKKYGGDWKSFNDMAHFEMDRKDVSWLLKT